LAVLARRPTFYPTGGLGIVWKTVVNMWHSMIDTIDLEIYKELKQTASHYIA
jgi:hypothetical protein